MAKIQAAKAPTLLTKSDAAKRLGLTPASVLNLELKGQLTALRTEGGMRLFRRTEVDRLARRRARKSAP